MMSKSLRPFIRCWLALGFIVGLARIAAFEHLEYAESTNTQTISDLPFVLLMLPEAIWIDWRGGPIVFGFLLLVGSFLAASIPIGMAFIIARVAGRSKNRRNSRP